MLNNARYWLTIFFTLLLHTSIVAQESTLISFLSQTEQKFEIAFNYAVNDIKDVTIPKVQEFETFSETLAFLRRNTPFLYRKVSDKIITVLPNEKKVFCGYLRDRDTDQIITGASVTVAGKSTVTDDEGYFEIQLLKNENISIMSLGYASAAVDGSFSTQRGCRTVYISREPIALETVELSGYLIKGINKLSNGSYQIDFRDFTLLPGLIETDVLQAAQALPGIQSIDETVSDINIRGGSNDQNLILWDNIKMYQTGHFFGLISAFNPNITQRVSVNKNGTEASHTDGVSGTISMQTDNEVARITNGSIGASLLSADGFLDLRLHEKSSIQFAFRHSINDFLRTPTYDSYFTRISQETEVSQNEENIVNSNQDFNFYDGSLRWLYEISDTDKLRLNFLIIGNDLSFRETAVTNLFTESKRSSLAQNTLSGGVYYEHTWNSKSKSHVQFYETDYTLRAINANVLNDQRLLQENNVSESSVRLQHDFKLTNLWRFMGGYHFTETGITNLDDVDNPLFRERITEVLRAHALFVEGAYRSLSQKTSLSLGVRSNYLEKFEKVIIEPRLSISHRFTTGLTFQALGEFKHQNTSQIISFQNDFLGIEKRRWQLANDKDIPVIESKQASLGLSYKKRGWLLDITGYYKTVDGITSQSQGFDTKYEFIRTDGSYQVLGTDILVQRNIGALSTWVSYGFMNNDYTFTQLEEGQFPSNFDITHSITLGATFQTQKWKISSGINWHTGQPTTIPESGNEVSLGEINFGKANSKRLDEYMRIDFSTLYQLFDTEHIRLESGISIWNVLNRENKIGNFYRVIEGNAISFEEPALGTTANATIRLYF